MLERKYPIVLAPTGMVPTRAMTPHVPLTPAEIAKDVERCAQIGITSVHLHARDEKGDPDWKKSIYGAIVYEVRSRVPEVLINVSTSGRNWSELELRADCLILDGDLKPDLASLTLSSLNFLSGPLVNSPETVYKLAAIMLDRGITPELELFDLGMVNMVKVMVKKGMLPGALVANLFVGNIAGAQATLGELGIMVDRLPEHTIWSGAGIGDQRDRTHAFSLAAGGGVRVGLEDGIYLDPDRKTLATNLSLVEKVHAMAELLDLEMLKPREFRQLIIDRPSK